MVSNWLKKLVLAKKHSGYNSETFDKSLAAVSFTFYCGSFNYFINSGSADDIIYFNLSSEGPSSMDIKAKEAAYL